MKVYLTGIDSIKASKRNYNQQEFKKPKKKLSSYEEETDGIKEESVNEDEGPTTRRKRSKRNQNFNNNIEIKKEDKEEEAKIEIKKENLLSNIITYKEEDQSNKEEMTFSLFLLYFNLVLFNMPFISLLFLL